MTTGILSVRNVLARVRDRSPVHAPRPALAATLLLAAAAVLTGAGPAAAAPGPAAGPAAAAPGTTTGAAVPGAGAPTGAAAQPGNHCVLAAGAATPTCYADFPAAIAAATGGRVRAPASATAAGTDPAFTSALNTVAVTSGTTVTGIEYANANYGGGTLTLTAPGPCDNSLDADWAWNTLPAGWNDVISSFKSYSNCAQQLFLNTYRGGGAITGILTNSSYVGATANDRASSLTAN